MSSTLIIPCGGKSTRFNNTRPKYLFTHPNGNLMLIEALNGLDTSNVSQIIITVIKEHIETAKLNLNKVEDKIVASKGIKPTFHILDEFTSSQSETVYKTILDLNITGPIFIKDCDNYFNTKLKSNNHICYSTLAKDINAVNKSYITLDKFGKLTGIVEKVVVGERFCVGGYSFGSAQDFVSTFEKINGIKRIDKGEIYISHIVQQMLFDGKSFDANQVSNYEDWGTKEDWNRYTKQFKTYFIDIDGVICQNSSEYFEPEWGTSEGLENNVKTINTLYDSGKCHIILTTSRAEEYHERTTDQMKKIGLRYHRVVFGLPHCQRVLVNDFSDTNPCPTAGSINLKRNEDKLEQYL